MSRPILALSIVLALAAVACGQDAASTDDTRLHGTVAQELRQPGMQAIAVAADGRWISTSVAANGDFTLDLRPGQPYRLVLATPVAGGGERIVARVVIDGTSGRTVWISTNANDIAFGTLHAVGTATASADPSRLSTLSESGETNEAEDDTSAESDSEEHDKGSYDACGASDAKDVEPSSDDASAHGDYAEHDDSKERSCDESDQSDEKEDD